MVAPVDDTAKFEDALTLLCRVHQREVMFWKDQCSSEVKIAKFVTPTSADDEERISVCSGTVVVPATTESPDSRRGSLSTVDSAESSKPKSKPKAVVFSEVGKGIRCPEPRAALPRSLTKMSPRSDMHSATSIPAWLQRDVAMHTTTPASSRGSQSFQCTAKMFAEAMGVERSVFDRTSERWSRNLSGAKIACQDRCHHLVQSVFFIGASTSLVVLNSLLIGWRTHQLAREPDVTDRFLFALFDRIFAGCFLVEISIRFIAEGSLMAFFYLSSNAKWNSFDLFLSSVDVVVLIIELAHGGRQAGIANFAVMRVVRILRICRAFRILRLLTMFKELRIMVLSLMLCGRSLFWSFVMLSVVIYLFSVYFISVTSHHLSSGWNDTDVHRELKPFCDGLPVLGYYLFQAMTGGMNWGTLSDLLIKIDPANGVGMIFFVIFTMFAVLNIITGVVVDSVLTNARSDTEEVINEQLTDDDSALRRLKDVFEEADKMKSGRIDYKQFQDMMNDGRTRALMASVGLKATKIRGLFKLMDLDNSGNLSIDEFLLQCMRLRGQAKAVDLWSLMYENKKMMNAFYEFYKFLSDEAQVAQSNQHIILAYLHELLTARVDSNGLDIILDNDATAKDSKMRQEQKLSENAVIL